MQSCETRNVCLSCQIIIGWNLPWYLWRQCTFRSAVVIHYWCWCWLSARYITLALHWFYWAEALIRLPIKHFIMTTNDCPPETLHCKVTNKRESGGNLTWFYLAIADTEGGSWNTDLSIQYPSLTAALSSVNIWDCLPTSWQRLVS